MAPRVRGLRQDRAGQAVARNRGVQAAQGELVGFLDADDLWQADKLARQVERFTARPELDYCLTHVQNFWDEELHNKAAAYEGHPRGQPMPGYVTGTLLARRALFDVVGGFDPSSTMRIRRSGSFGPKPRAP